MANRFRVLLTLDLFAFRQFVHLSLPNELTDRLITPNKRCHLIAITGQGRAGDHESQKQPGCLPMLVGQGRSADGPSQESRKPEACVPLRLAPRADNGKRQYDSKQGEPYQPKLNQDRYKGVVGYLTQAIHRAIHATADTYKRMFLKSRKAFTPIIHAIIEIALSDFSIRST